MAWWVNALVYGREATVPVNSHEKTYRDPGYIDAPGVIRMGQSVFLMPPGIAQELLNALSARDVPCTATEVYRRTGPAQG